MKGEVKTLLQRLGTRRGSQARRIKGHCSDLRQIAFDLNDNVSAQAIESLAFVLEAGSKQAYLEAKAKFKGKEEPSHGERSIESHRSR